MPYFPVPQNQVAVRARVGLASRAVLSMQFRHLKELVLLSSVKYGECRFPDSNSSLAHLNQPRQDTAGTGCYFTELRRKHFACRQASVLVESSQGSRPHDERIFTIAFQHT